MQAKIKEYVNTTQRTEGEEVFQETEIGLIPSDWKVVRLGDVGIFQYGYTTSAIEEKTGVKFLRITDIKEEGKMIWENVPYCKLSENELEKYRLAEGDILFARIGATTGKTCIIESPPISTFGSYLIRLQIKEKSKFSPKFIYYFTNTDNYWSWINANKEGKLKKGISASFLKTLPIPFPQPYEQRKIGKVLGTIQRAIEQQDKIIEAAKNLKKSLMQKLFTEGIGHTEFKETEIGTIPQEWHVLNMGDIVIRNKGLQRGPWGGSVKKDIFVKKGYKVYEQKNVIRNNFELGNYYINEEKFKELNDFEVFAGDILVTAAGTLGRIAIAPFGVKKGIMNQALLRIRLNEAVVHKPYFIYFFTKVVNEGLMSMYSHGATLKNLTSLKTLRSIRILLPPYEEQREIASILSRVDKKIEVEERRKVTLKELFKTMLHKLMTGEIRLKDVEV